MQEDHLGSSVIIQVRRFETSTMGMEGLRADYELERDFADKIKGSECRSVLSSKMAAISLQFKQNIKGAMVSLRFSLCKKLFALNSEQLGIFNPYGKKTELCQVIM